MLGGEGLLGAGGAGGRLGGAGHEAGAGALAGWQQERGGLSGHDLRLPRHLATPREVEKTWLLHASPELGDVKAISRLLEVFFGSYMAFRMGLLPF